MARIPLEIGDGFRKARVVADEWRLVLSGERTQLADPALERMEPLSFQTQYNCDFAYSAREGLVYFSDGDLRCLDLATRSARLVAKAPEGDVDEVLFQKQTQSLTPEQRQWARRPAFNWFLASSPDGKTLATLLHQQGASARFVLLDVATSRMKVVPLEGWASGTDASFHSGRLCLPGVDGGRRVLDFEGKEMVRLDLAPFMGDRPMRWTPYFDSASFSPDGTVVALGGIDPGLVLWDPEHSGTRLVDAAGRYPAWAPDGSRIYYLHDDHELWSVNPDGSERQLVVGLLGNRGKPYVDRPGSFGTKPVPSPCGRYVVAQLTRYVSTASNSAPEFAFLLVDAKETKVHFASSSFFHQLAWVSSR